MTFQGHWRCQNTGPRRVQAEAEPALRKGHSEESTRGRNLSLHHATTHWAELQGPVSPAGNQHCFDPTHPAMLVSPLYDGLGFRTVSFILYGLTSKNLP